MIDPSEVIFATGPADRGCAEDAFAQAYRAVGQKRRPGVIWMPSPAAALRFAERSGGEALWVGPHRDRHMLHWIMLHGLADLMNKASQTGLPKWVDVANGPTPVDDRVRHAVSIALEHDVPLRTPPAGLCQPMHGQHDYDMLAPALELMVRGMKIDALTSACILAARATGWWWPMEHVVVAAERPTEAHRDDAGRLHSADSKAIVWPDGWGVHIWHGVRVPDWVIETPAGELSAWSADREQNVEIRRAIIERMGYERYLQDAGRELVHEDDCGKLWRQTVNELLPPPPPPEPLTVVEVVNATPEPNGAYRHFWIRVPAAMRTARQAVAWTFEMEEDEYRPHLQS